MVDNYCTLQFQETIPWDGMGFFATLQVILDLCIPEKELAKTRSQISFI